MVIVLLFTVYLVRSAMCCGIMSEQDISVALNPSVAFRTADLNLTQGQLTSRGFMQHVRLGNKLQTKYGEVLDRVTSNDQIYVRSTKYVRTIKSVTGLMMSLLPSLGSSARPVDISVHGNEEDEVMHGIGLRTSSHSTGSTTSINSGGETEFTGSCEAAVSLAKKEKDVFVQSTHMEQRLVDIFGPHVLNKTQNEIADASVPNLCHGVPLPCASSGAVRRSIQQQCLQHSDLLLMMEEADRSYCEKYTGSNGGANATSRAIYPFMKEILTHLKLSAEEDSLKTTPRVLSLFSGHDTVIAPVLAALGVYKDELCGWPSYASHIIFELWHHRNSDKPVHYIRVLYNGLDLTQHIPTCGKERSVLIKKHNSGEGLTNSVEVELLADGSPLCSLSALGEQIPGMISPHSSIQEACKM